jgi:Xaa-Pro aminopeptidase
VPDQNYLYLTGLREAGGALVLRARGGVAEAQLFVADKVPAEEVWTGNRLGAAAARAVTGIPTSSRAALVEALKQTLKPTDTLLVANDTSSGQPAGQLLHELRGPHGSLPVRSASALVRRLRAKKSDAELALIRKAAELTLIGFDAAVAATAPGRYEFELEAALKSAYRRHGADAADGFPPIIASGDNATTLHYEANDSLLPPNGLVLMDVGAAYHDYVADFTRTIPVSGRFSADQRALYQVVLDAQLAAERTAKSRASFAVVSDSGRRALAAGLARLGLIESPDATFDAGPGENCPKGPDGGCYQWFLYYMHSVGHGVGLDVHDPMLPNLEPGTVFMIEMAAYVRRRMETLVASTPRNAAFLSRTAAARQRFAGTGVRMEDEYITTANGPELITPWPRGIAEVEARTMQLRASAPRRDETAVRKFPRARALR